MKIVVTGAAGFIGSHLVEALLTADHEVVGIDNLNSYYPTPLKEFNAEQIVAAGCDLRRLDLAVDDLADAVAGADVVYHSAAQPGISSRTAFETYQRNNILATHRLLQAVQQHAQISLFVNIGTSSIYGAMAVGSEDLSPQPISFYGVTKLAAEQLALAQYRDNGFPATSFRLFSVYGPRERPDKLYPRLIHSIVDGVPFPLFANSREHERSFTYVADVVASFVYALERPQVIGEIINIGTTESITTGQAIEIVEDILGQEANMIEKPPRPGDQQKTHARIDKAKALLGYNPQTPFAEGIRHEIEWFKQLPDHLRTYYDPPG